MPLAESEPRDFRGVFASRMYPDFLTFSFNKLEVSEIPQQTSMSCLRRLESFNLISEAIDLNDSVQFDFSGKIGYNRSDHLRKDEKMKTYKLGILGYGNMASAIAGGILKKNVLRADQILVCDRDPQKTDAARAAGFCPARDHQQLADDCEFVLLSVKPQMFEEAVSGIRFDQNALISIMAGVRIDRIESLTGCRAARIMPNTPALVGKGISAVDASHLTTSGRQFVVEIFGAVGEVLECPEDKMDGVTAVSGSGPAYVYLWLDSLIRSGQKLGFSEAEARKLAVQTFAGAAEMVKQSEEPLEVLIDRVCSKGGTTIEAVKTFRSGGQYELTEEAVRACFQRSRELSSL